MDFSTQQIEILDDERTIALIFFAGSLYMFMDSYSYSAQAATWPRYIALATMFGSLLTLFQNRLPEIIKILVQEDYQAIDKDEELREQAKDDKQDFNARYALFTTVSIIGFGIVIVLFGYVVATVLFISVYSLYFNMNAKYSLVIIGICLTILYLVGPPLNIPIFEGLADIIPPVRI